MEEEDDEVAAEAGALVGTHTTPATLIQGSPQGQLGRNSVVIVTTARKALINLTVIAIEEVSCLVPSLLPLYLCLADRPLLGTIRMNEDPLPAKEPGDSARLLELMVAIGALAVLHLPAPEGISMTATCSTLDDATDLVVFHQEDVKHLKPIHRGAPALLPQVRYIIMHHIVAHPYSLSCVSTSLLPRLDCSTDTNH